MVHCKIIILVIYIPTFLFAQLVSYCYHKLKVAAEKKDKIASVCSCYVHLSLEVTFFRLKVIRQRIKFCCFVERVDFASIPVQAYYTMAAFCGILFIRFCY